MWIQVLPSKAKEENCTGGYSRGLRNQKGEHLFNPCESNILETQFIQLYDIELARTFESKHNIKIKITRQIRH